MTRTVWLALSCLAGLGAIIAIKAATTPSLSLASVAAPPEQSAAAEESFAPNRAMKADRLPIPDGRAPTEPASAPQPVAAPPAETPLAAIDLFGKPDDPPQTPTVAAAGEAPRRPAGTHPHRRWQDANAKLVATSPPRRHAKAPPARADAANAPPKATVNVVPCRQDAMGGLLRALDLSPHCSS